MSLFDPTDCSPPVSSVHGILQARILEWVAITFFRESSPSRDQTSVSCSYGLFLVLIICMTSRLFQRRHQHPTPVLLPGKSHGQRSLVGCSPWGREESYTTAWLHFHFSLSGTGEGNGNPSHCFCLENPRVEGAWQAAVYGIVQSQTRLKRLSSSSSMTSRLLIKYPQIGTFLCFTHD